MRFRAMTLALLLPLGWLGCRNCGSTAGAPSEPAPDASPAAKRRALPHFRIGGAAGYFFHVLGEIDMRDEQRGPLEKLAADLAATADAGLEESPAALAGLTSGIEAGKLDPAKLQLHYAAIEQTAIVRKAHEDEALDRLHAILDGPQRGAVAVRARASLEKHEKRPRFRDENGRSVPLQRILHRLDLDPAQRQKAELLLPTDDGAETYREDAKRHHEALLTTFDKEAFDATKIESNGGKNARLAAEDAVKFSAQLLPLLKTEQRERLARLLASRSYEHSRFSGVNDGDDD